MRIVIDYQGAQSGGSRHRGIGRYTSAITRAIIRQAPDSEIILLLNEGFADTIEPIRAEYEELLPQENIVVWRPLHPIAHIHPANDHRRKASELLREAIVARLNPDALLITSHFEGSDDDGATTVGSLPANYPTAIILYDLIPYIYRSTYLAIPVVERWYEERVGGLKKADLLLAISDSSRQEAIDYIGYSPDHCVSIGTAADPQFRKIELNDDQRRTLFAKYGITKPFVMYTGGIDHRKNIEGLIRAFANLPEAIRRKHQLAIVCSMRAEDRPRLRQVGRDAGLGDDELLLTGFVPEKDLIGLYNSCQLFVFPSWHEGFGLPALEAMWCGAPVIAANSSSLPEVVGSPAALFDARQDASITKLMATALQNEKFRQRLIDNGAKRTALFSWSKSALSALAAMEREVAARETESRADPMGYRPRLAMITPAPPAESGIAHYSATLIRALQRFYRIDLVLRAGLTTNDPFILANCRVIDDNQFRRQCKDYDRVVYHFGNSDHHTHMCDLIKECPGVVVLHDFFVSGLSEWREHHGNVPGNWCNDLNESHGLGALLERHTAPDLLAVVKKYPCSYATTRHALGVLCHSQEAKDLQLRWHGREAARDWAVIPMIRAMPKLPSRADARRSLGIGDGEFIVCAFGILGESKLNHHLIEAWSTSSAGKHAKSRLIFVGGYGPQAYHEQLCAMAEASPASGSIEFAGWVDDSDYWTYLASADVAVQLRGNTRGETSAATLDAMMAGVPVVANASPSLPAGSDEAIALIPADAAVEELARVIDRMFVDDAWRHRMGEVARAFALLNHSEDVCGRKFAHEVEQSYRRSMQTFNAAIEQSALLDLNESEAISLAVEYAGLLDQQSIIYLDISDVMPTLPQDFSAFLRPLLLTLADRAPQLRVIAIHRLEDQYVSALCPLMRAALLPNLDQSADPIRIKSFDYLVSLQAEDSVFARDTARAAGARYLSLKEIPKEAYGPVADALLKFVGNEIGKTDETVTKIARAAPVSAANDAGSPRPSRPSKSRGKRRGKPVPAKGRKR